MVMKQVYGLEFYEGSSGNYTVYNKWEGSPQQLQEMITFDGVKSLKVCELSD